MLALEPTQTLAGKVKLELGIGFTTTLCEALALHPVVVTVRLMVFVPLDAQVTVCGPAVDAVAGLAPVPKFHEYVEPAAAVPLNVTVALLPAHTGDGFTVKLAVGAAFTVTVAVVVELHVPEVTVKVTVLEPAVDQLTTCGPAVLAVAGLAPDPKFQLYVAPAGADPVYVKVPLAFTHKAEGLLNVLDGGAVTTTF